MLGLMSGAYYSSVLYIVHPTTDEELPIVLNLLVYHIQSKSQQGSDVTTNH